MKILKNILISLGVIFLLFRVLFIYLSIDSDKFKDEQEPFIESFMHEFSSDWNVRDVYPKLTNNFIQQIETQAGRHALNIFKTLGEYESMSDLSISNYNTGTDGTTAIFTFKAQFTSGPALVSITLLKDNDKTLVHGLHITPSNNTPGLNTRHEA